MRALASNIVIHWYFGSSRFMLLWHAQHATTAYTVGSALMASLWRGQRKERSPGSSKVTPFDLVWWPWHISTPQACGTKLRCTHMYENSCKFLYMCACRYVVATLAFGAHNMAITVAYPHNFFCSPVDVLWDKPETVQHANRLQAPPFTAFRNCLTIFCTFLCAFHLFCLTPC